MKAVITKLKYPCVVIVGEGDDQVVTFARTMFQANEVARAHGATEVDVKDYKECLRFTHGLDGEQPSSTTGTDNTDQKARTNSRK